MDFSHADDCDVILVTGQRLHGSLRQDDSGWWLLQTSAGDVLINPDHLVAVAPAGAFDGVSQPASPVVVTGGEASPAPKKRRGSGSPGRPWQDDELRMLADAFLDGVTDKELAKEFGRTPAVIKQLRQGFECARGNLVEDQITEVAQTWVPRWRKVFSPS